MLCQADTARLSMYISLSLLTHMRYEHEFWNNNNNHDWRLSACRFGQQWLCRGPWQCLVRHVVEPVGVNIDQGGGEMGCARLAYWRCCCKQPWEWPSGGAPPLCRDEGEGELCRPVKFVRHGGSAPSNSPMAELTTCTSSSHRFR